MLELIGAILGTIAMAAVIAALIARYGWANG